MFMYKRARYVPTVTHSLKLQLLIVCKIFDMLSDKIYTIFLSFWDNFSLVLSYVIVFCMAFSIIKDFCYTVIIILLARTLINLILLCDSCQSLSNPQNSIIFGDLCSNHYSLNKQKLYKKIHQILNDQKEICEIHYKIVHEVRQMSHYLLLAFFFYFQLY